MKVEPFEGKKKFEKKSQCPKKLKIERGDPSVSSGFANARKKFLAKARTRTRDHWVHRKPSKVCTKKWYIHDEVCGLTKKQDGNVPSRRHILGSKIFKEQLLEKFGKFFFQKKRFDFFSKKKYFLGRTMPKNSKRGHSGSFNVFYKPKTSKKFKGVPFDKFRKFSKKVA